MPRARVAPSRATGLLYVGGRASRCSWRWTKGEDTMPVRVTAITLWRADVDHQAGVLAQTLEPLAAAGVDLQAVMGYRLPGDHARAAIEVFPITGAKALSAAQAAGLSEASIGAVRVEGENRPGLGHAIAKALAGAGINMDFFLGQVSGGRQVTVIGFNSRADVDRAIPLIKAAAAPPRKPVARKTRSRGARATKRGRTSPRRR